MHILLLLYRNNMPETSCWFVRNVPGAEIRKDMTRAVIL